MMHVLLRRRSRRGRERLFCPNTAPILTVAKQWRLWAITNKLESQPRNEVANEISNGEETCVTRNPASHKSGPLAGCEYSVLGGTPFEEFRSRLTEKGQSRLSSWQKSQLQ